MSAGYIRTKEVTLGRAQRMVANFGQAALLTKGVPDLLGEERALASWGEWAGRFAVGEDVVERQVERFRTAAAEADDAGSQWLQAFGWGAYCGGVRGGRTRSPTPLGGASPLTDEEQGGDVEGVDTGESGDDEAGEADSEGEESAGEGSASPPEPVGLDYVVSISCKKQIRTLHRVGWCFRIPGVHYREYVNLGAVLPEGANFHRCCKSCWVTAGEEGLGGAGRGGGDEGELEPEAGLSTSSSSTSDEGKD